MTPEDLRATILDGRTKGIPGTAAPFALGDIAAKGWNVLAEDMPLPLMVLKRSALDHNARAFGDYLVAGGLSLAPHGKTTMSPQIFAEQLAQGAWGMTAATVGQVQVMHACGIRRVVLANQLLGRAHVAAVKAMIAEDPAFAFFCFVDSVAQLDNITRHLGTPARPLNLLLEVGVTGGRTGLRSMAEARDVMAAIAAADPACLRFAGIAAFEGVVPGMDRSAAPVRDFARLVLDVAAAVPPRLLAGMDEFILTGGGSTHFDIIADTFRTLRLPVPVRVLLRSGCYVTHDSGAYVAAMDQARADPDRRDHLPEPLRPALQVWAYVQSMPEPGLAFLTMGKRDVPHDAGLPVPQVLYRPGTGFLPVGQATVFALNDQHAYVRLGPDAGWQVGDMVGSGISHPCTAFDKWRFIPVVNDAYDVIDGVLTFF